MGTRTAPPAAEPRPAPPPVSPAVLAGIVALASDAIISCDARQRIILFNTGAEEIFGWRAEEVMGEPLALLIPERFRDSHERHMNGFALSGTPALRMGHRGEIVGRRRSGEEFPAEASISRQVVDGESVFTTVLHDVTERRRAEEALARKAEELARSNAELEQFAYVASHDLQEPLRMVAGYTRLLERRYRDALDQEAREFIDYAVEGVTRMQRLINDLLAYSRVGTRGEQLVPVSAAEVLENVLSVLRPTTEELGGEVTAGPLPPVVADAGQLGQLFQNLIANALKFHGPRPPRVRVDARRAGADWVFRVADNGIGVEPEYAERIFVIFQRLHSRAEYPGTGIGLAICKKIVERHGGRIWVESTPGEGAAFHFTLPFAPPRPTEPAAASPARRVGESPTEDPPIPGRLRPAGPVAS